MINVLLFFLSCGEPEGKEFTAQLKDIIDSGASIDTPFVELFNKELPDKFPQKQLVIKEVNDNLLPSIENSYDVDPRDRGNFKIMIKDSLFLVNDRSENVREAFKEYLVEIADRGFSMIGSIDFTMQASETDGISSYEINKFIYGLKEIDNIIDELRDESAKYEYGKNYLSLDSSNKEKIKQNIENIMFCIYSKILNFSLNLLRLQMKTYS